MREMLESLLFNLSQKTRNPFFGTMITVFIFRHWKFIYTLWNFDENITIAEKQSYIYIYFSNKNWHTEIVSTVIISIAALIVSYFFLNVSRLIINWFENIVTPMVYKLTDANTIVLKSKYDLLSRENERLQKKFEQERSERIKINDEFEKYILKNNKNIEPSEKIESSLGQTVAVDQGQISSGLEGRSKLVYEKLQRDRKLGRFMDAYDDIRKENPLSDQDEIVDYFVRLRLIYKTAPSSIPGKSFFKPSEIGKTVYDWNLLNT